MGEINSGQTDGSAVKVALPVRLDSASAKQLLNELAQHEATDICLDFSEVQHIGGQCLQVLLNLKHHWELNNLRVSTTGLGQQVEDQLVQLGIEAGALETGTAS